MKQFFLIPTMFFSLIAIALPGTHGNGTLQENVDSLLGPQPDQKVLIIDERELLRRYLNEIERRNEAETRTELAKIEFQREIFSAYNDRWWVQYRDNKNDKRVNDYWVAYSDGKRFADNTLREKGAGNNSCLLLRELVNSSTEPNVPSAPGGNRELGEAYRRGIVAENPECFIAGLTDKVKGFLVELDRVDRKLLDINISVQDFKPDERRMEAVYRDLEGQLKKVAVEIVTASLPKIQRAITMDPAHMVEIQNQVTALANQIDCPNLKGPSGQSLSCDLKVVDSKDQLDNNAIYKILFQKSRIATYQKGITFQDLPLAVHTYEMTHPQDRMVHVQFEALRSQLADLDRVVDESVANARKSMNIAIEDRMRDFKLDNIDLWRSLFARDVAGEMIQIFFSLRQRMVSYQRVDLGTQVEANLLAEAKGVYSHALENAAQIKLSVELPRRAIHIELNDVEGTIIDLPFEIDAPPAGYMLGRDYEQVKFWHNYLQLQ